MEVLYTKTGSTGNCTILQSTNGEMIAIDAGIEFKKVNKAVDYSLHDCTALLTTHCHQDHSNHAAEFVRRGIQLYCPLEVITKGIVKNGYDAHILKDRKQFEIGDFKVVPFSLVHENATGSPCECYGFLINDNVSGERLLHVTDTQMIPYRFPPLEYYNIEANYWEQTEWADDIDVVEKSVEMRRMKSHMSVETAADFLQKQDLSKCKQIHLLHLSNSITKEKREQIIPYIQEKIGRYNIEILA